MRARAGETPKFPFSLPGKTRTKPHIHPFFRLDKKIALLVVEINNTSHGN